MWFFSESLICDVVGRETETVNPNDDMVGWEKFGDPGAHNDRVVWMLSRRGARNNKCDVVKAICSRHTAVVSW